MSRSGETSRFESLPDAVVALRQLIRHSPLAMLLTEGEGHAVRCVNGAFCKLVSSPVEEVVGQPFADLRPPGGAGEIARLLDRVLRTGNGLKEEEVSVTVEGNGRMTWCCTAWPLAGDDGVRGVFLQISDRTERAESRRRLQSMAEDIRAINERVLGSALREQQLAERAEAASQAKSNFLAVVSHELRTPLTGIVGYADVLEAGAAGELTPKQRESVERIRRCSTALAELIDDVITFARIDADDLEVVWDRVDLSLLAGQALEELQAAAAEKGQSLRLISADGPVWWVTDEGKVRKILAALLSNAVKFTPRGGRIELEVGVGGAGARLAVRDTGIGIAPEHIQGVFEPFVQMEAPYTRQAGGTGLGLSLGRSLASCIGGKIEVESRAGEGSVFRLQLPPRGSAPQAPDGSGTERR